MKQIADYRILDQLREGNHGTVYLAQPPTRLAVDADVVALKALRQHATQDDFRRVANELRLLNSIKSEHLVHLLDAGSDDGLLFFVTPFYTDGSIEYAAAHASPDEMTRWVADAARGAHRLHEHGIAHRDIKPANVFVSDGRGVLGELGLAQLVGGGSTVVGAGPLGAIEFTAPDIIWGHPATRATDIWSLAMTLHRGLTGTCALGALPTDNVLNACRHVLHSEPELDSSLTGTVRDVLQRALGLDDQAGYSTAEEFANDLERTLSEGTS